MNTQPTKTVTDPTTVTGLPSPVEMAALSLVLNALAWACHTALIDGSSLAAFALLTGAVAFVGAVSLALSLRARSGLRRTPIARNLRPLIGLSIAVALAALIVAAILLLNLAVFLWRTR